MNQLVPFRSADGSPALVAASGDQARVRFLGFFTANIRYPACLRTGGERISGLVPAPGARAVDCRKNLQGLTSLF
jgi:hypothetical protein